MSLREEIGVDDNEYQRARKRAIYLLGEKAYCSKELYEKLLKNYSEETCKRVLADMTDYGYIDDEKYAKKYAEYLIKGKKHGLHKARFEMQQKGIARAIADEALAEYDKEDYRAEIAALIEKKYKNKLDAPDDVRRTIAALARRGYGYSDIKAALERVSENATQDIDYEED